MNIEEVRKYFPVVDELIFLDHAAVAPLSTRVVGAVEECLQWACEGGGNSAAEFERETERVRRLVARLIGAQPEEIAFTKNTSEGISLVAHGIPWSPGDNLIITDQEFPSNVYPWISLEEIGVNVKIINSRDGRILPEDIDAHIDKRTRLVSISSVQYLNGFRADLEAIGNICRERGVLFCVDAIQSLGAYPLDVRKSGIDFLAADGHKWLLAPEGTGIFFCRRNQIETLRPISVGWKSVIQSQNFDRIDLTLKPDASRFECGSLNIMGIFALGAALDLIFEIGIEAISKQITSHSELIRKELQKRKIPILSPSTKKERSGIVSFRVQEPHSIHRKLKLEKIITSVRADAIRLSPHCYNTREEIQTFFSALDRLIKD